MSKKLYIVDTNVIMAEGKKALTAFGDNEVIIPFPVVEELEKKRLEEGMVGSLARFALREIEHISQLGKLKDGITINAEGGTLRVELNHKNLEALPPALRSDDMRAREWSKDTRIIAVAQNFYLEEQAKPDSERREVILVTNDVPLRIKVDSALDFSCEPFKTSARQYPGMGEKVYVGKQLVDELFTNRNTRSVLAPREVVKTVGESSHHAFRLGSYDNTSGGCPLAVYANGELSLVDESKAFGNAKGKSDEQKVAIHYLSDEIVKILSLGGKAGTGKTLLAASAGITQVQEGKYKRTVIIRPIYAVGGQDLGALPGDINEKMDPWKKAIYDSVSGWIPENQLKSSQDSDQLDVIPATHLRGRTFHETFVIVDEAQNFEPSVLLTILSRIGHKSKIVFLWDATQRDNSRVSATNGIVSVVEKLRSNEMFAHVSLRKSERSAIAELAGNLLEDYLS